MNDTVATVDLGSNSFHMIVARLSGSGDLQIIDRLREAVRLAEGLEASKTLQPEAMERALACLERFGQRLASLPPDCVRIVGTNTLRRARDAGAFLDRVEKALGHSVDIISGAEEARLIYAGVAPDVDPNLKRRLVIDIGGGSTEIIAGQGLEPRRLESMGLGCVSHTQRYFPDGALTRKAWNTAVTAASLELEPHIRAFQRQGWDTAVGTSGTIKATHAVLQAQGWLKDGMTLKALKQFRKALLAAGHIDALALEGLSSSRRPVIAGGLAILWAIFEGLQIERMEISERALRDGLLYDLVGRLHDQDVRSRSVAAMAARYEVDVEHAERLATTACELLEQVSVDWSLPRHTSRQLLRWAAYLHEIGLVITHTKYNRHSAYLVENSDLEGFSQNQQRILSAMVYLHRGKFDATQFSDLATRDVQMTTRLSMLLRMAFLFLRSRDPAPLPALRASASDKTLTLYLPDDWLDDHALTRADLEREQRYVRNTGLKLLIKREALNKAAAATD